MGLRGPVHEALHARWCFREGVFQTRDTSENLRESYQHIARRLDRDVDVVGTIVARVFVSWSSNVDLVLENGRESH